MAGRLSRSQRSSVEVDVAPLLPGLAGVLLEVLGEGLELEEEAPLPEKGDRVLLAHELERHVLLVSQVGSALIGPPLIQKTPRHAGAPER